MADIDAFRTEVRTWLDTNCPPAMRTPILSDEDRCFGGRHFEFRSEAQRTWLNAMAARGWTAPTWPTEYGGGGLDRAHAKALQEELDQFGARPPLYSFGILMIGPALLKYGSEKLKLQHLPPIVRGEIRWAQGYSEPNAGSDLANVQATLEDRGDHFILNGSKIWTSYGDHGDWMFCLARSDRSAKKQSGISLVLFDMTTPGVETRPIRLISGKSPFTETFLKDVRVEKDQIVGDLNAGWSVAKYLLTHERETLGEWGLTPTNSETLGATAARLVGLEHGRLSDPALRAEIARLEIDDMALQITMERARDELLAGASHGAKSSLFKYTGSELTMRRQELLMAIHGAAALDWDGPGAGGGALPRAWLRSRGNSIEGGTSEVQLNIIAKQLLGLPS